MQAPTELAISLAYEEWDLSIEAFGRSMEMLTEKPITMEEPPSMEVIQRYQGVKALLSVFTKIRERLTSDDQEAENLTISFTPRNGRP